MYTPKYAIALFLMLFAALAGTAQEAIATATVSLSRDSILIGETTQLEAKIAYRKDQGGAEIKWLTSNTDSLADKIEVYSWSEIVKSIDNDDIFLHYETRTLELTSFEDGFHAIPPFEFLVNGDTLVSNAVLLQVKLVESEEENQFVDIKEIREVKYGIADWLSDNWKWLLGILLGVTAVVLLIIKLTRKKEQKEIVKTTNTPKMPAHQTALLALEALRQKGLWQAGEIKEYQAELSLILRTYLEQRFGIDTLEQTTSEIVRSLSHSVLTQEDKKNLKDTLQLADMVKFAKQKPLPEEHENAFSTVLRFVEKFKSAEETSPEKIALKNHG